jgi:hypothetical protein
MTKIFVSIVAIIALLIFILYVTGLILPKQRKAERRTKFDAPVERVWEIVTNIEEQVKWRPSLTRVKVQEHSGDFETWIEYPKNGPAIFFKTKLKNPPTRFEFELTDAKTWKGYWTGEFTPLANHKTSVTFTECSEIANPFIRVLSYVFFDLGATIDQYLKELADKLGEKY